MNIKIMIRWGIAASLVLLAITICPKASAEGADYSVTSKRIPYLLWGARFFDINGDGKKELVAISENAVHAFEYTLPLLKETKKIDLSPLDRNVRIDLGSDQLFITSFSSGRLSSFALRSGFEKNFSDVSWYLRALQWDGALRLLGQHVGIADPFVGSISELALDGKKLKVTADIKLPRMTDIYGPVEMPLSDEGDRMMADLQLNGHLYLWKLEGSKWKKLGRSAGRYGDTANCVQYELRDVLDEAKSEYLCVPPSPVLVALKDGHTRVLVSDHKMYLSKVFGNIPFPKEGRIVGLDWDETLGWRETWQTSFIPGYITDYFIDNDPADGRSKLFLIVQVKDGGLGGSISRGESVLVVYELDRM